MEPLVNVAEVKATRITQSTGFSPQQIQEGEMSIVRDVLSAYYVDNTRQREVELQYETEQQDKDSKPHDEWKNPKANGRLKPTRKGNTQETTIEEG